MTLPTITVKVTGFLKNTDGPKSYIINKIKNTKNSLDSVAQAQSNKDLVKKMLNFYNQLANCNSLLRLLTCLGLPYFLCKEYLALKAGSLATPPRFACAKKRVGAKLRLATLAQANLASGSLAWSARWTKRGGHTLCRTSAVVSSPG